MALTYNTIDADGHILEPLDLWDKYIDPEFRERRPRFVIDENGKERLKVEGKLLGNPRGIGSLGSVGVRQGTVKPDTLKYAEGKKGGFDPHARIVDMNSDGIDAAFLYPSLGLFAGAVEDPGLAAGMCRAYNRWLADYCKPYPDRLFGVAMLPMQSVELAIEEMRYAREALGMRGGFLRPNPYHGNKMISDPMYEPVISKGPSVCHERAVYERCGTVREMKEGSSRPAVRCRSQATPRWCRPAPRGEFGSNPSQVRNRRGAGGSRLRTLRSRCERSSRWGARGLESPFREVA